MDYHTAKDALPFTGDRNSDKKSLIALLKERGGATVLPREFSFSDCDRNRYEMS